MATNEKLLARVASRFRVLRAVYDLTDGRTETVCTPSQVCERANVDRHEVDEALLYLMDEAWLVTWPTTTSRSPTRASSNTRPISDAPSVDTRHFPGRDLQRDCNEHRGHRLGQPEHDLVPTAEQSGGLARGSLSRCWTARITCRDA